MKKMSEGTPLGCGTFLCCGVLASARVVHFWENLVDLKFGQNCCCFFPRLKQMRKPLRFGSYGIVSTVEMFLFPTLAEIHTALHGSYHLRWLS